MNYFAYDRLGAAVHAPGVTRMQELLGSLGTDDLEHCSVSLTHESGWCLSASTGGVIVLENVETGEGPWHMRSIGADRILDFWRALANGEHEHLLRLPWLVGYGN